ncbi:MAG: hypothetical protein QF541_11815 [Lentisphaeria bacterium]|jgi:hypothetical protein|nr:hypothetical protein [Lentisphaeria bacterium]
MTYLETFENGPGGWVADTGIPLPIWDNVAYCHGPWTLDANHAPPGAGYLHLLMYLVTSGEFYSDNLAEVGATNRFVDEQCSTDLRGATITIRSRGQIQPTGPLCNNSGFRPEWQPGERPEMVLLVQSRYANAGPNYVLTGQPFNVTKDWTEQSVTLTDDESQWTFLGARNELQEKYSYAPIAEVLRNVNVDLIFVLSPLSFEPHDDVPDKHAAWAMKEYTVDAQRLPKGVVMFDWVRIDYP